MEKIDKLDKQILEIMNVEYHVRQSISAYSA